LEGAQEQFAEFMRIAGMYLEVATTPQLGIATNDSWIRDYGPIFVINDEGQIACHDFQFNGWGGKYETRNLDNEVPRQIAQHLDLPCCTHSMVLEGGSIDVNGCGTVMTTRQCLLNENRNPAMSIKEIEAELHRALGTRHVIWLPGGIEGDDTDGHIDDVARFVDPQTVLAPRAAPEHPDFAVLERNWDALGQTRDQDGQPLRRIALPVPEPISYDYPPDRWGPGGLQMVPASYANFVMANGALLVPIFGQRTDDSALKIFSQTLPDYCVIGVPADLLVVGLGSLHCLSQQEPQPTSISTN
ncbi:MAG: agmatine deiminase family protein, partial [Planctomycetales bacterium]|nr:agmatine deiminase family protein [Planctomycetales bacterium]